MRCEGGIFSVAKVLYLWVLIWEASSYEGLKNSIKFDSQIEGHKGKKW